MVSYRRVVCNTLLAISEAVVRDESVFILGGKCHAIRDISLTMGAGGLLNRWGGGSLNSETLFWGEGDHSIPGPIYGGINKSSSWRVHKIDLIEDHGF